MGLEVRWLNSWPNTGIKNELKILGIPDRIVEHGSPKELHRECGYDAPSIVQAVVEMRNRDVTIPEVISA